LLPRPKTWSVILAGAPSDFGAGLPSNRAMKRASLID